MNKKIILEDVGDYNPIEILRTAGKYYIELAKSPNPREQFKKDLKDAGVDDFLQGASAIPFIGMPFGIASIGLNLGAGNTQQALIQAIITASAAIGVSAAGKGFKAAAANPQVAQAVAKIITNVSSKMGRLPAIGPKIVSAVQSMKGQLGELLGELAEIATEEQIAKAEDESNRIKGVLDKLAASQPAKKLSKAPSSTDVGSGEMFAGNRKDVKQMRELLRKRRMQENSQVKITKSLLRTIIKEEIEEAFRLESDFKVGDVVKWSTLEKISKKTASGKTKIDYDRVLRTGEIEELYRSPRGTTPGSAKVMDNQGNSHEVEISELTLA
tara:strand:- start:6682 stop:7662 length:981 start_codon:yes stop_codon:yes gene_type:complete